jgi:phosphate starvation-inducible PhoH-like protein
MDKQIPLETRDEAQALFGPYDQYLKAVRSKTGAQIVVRNGAIQISGTRVQAEQAHRMFLEIKEVLDARGKLGEGDLDRILESERRAKPATASAPGVPAYRRKEAELSPKSSGQKSYMDAIEANEIVFAIGPSGTGKTFLAVAKAVEYLKAGKVRRLVLVRPAVEAGERLGFLPGDIQQKVDPYLRPIYDSLNAFLELGQVKRLIDADVIEIVPLAFMRGRTLDEAFIILDEAQNTTGEQMKMFLTRMGAASRVVVTGDVTQIDLAQGKLSGLVDARDLLKGIPGIEFVFLTKADIVRHPLVQRIVDAYETRKTRRP